MKKHSVGARFSILGYFLFLLPLTIIVAIALILFNYLQNHFESTLAIAIILFIYIMLATLTFTIIDLFRRIIMVDRPVQQILDATQKISKGDFNVKIKPLHSFYKYDEYDLIMENINKMVEELNKSEIMKTDFISNVSHEIKTPLSILQNYAKVLCSKNLDEETRKKYLQIIVDTSQKLSNLVTNILKLNKLENQSILPEHVETNVSELLRESILQFEDLFKAKDIELKCSIDDTNFVTDASYLEIIFNNLISNAIKFCNKNGKIIISLANTKDAMLFSVKDNGCGMNSEIGAKIFEKFYQGDSSHSSEGNGLGLALVKQVIDLLGGTITVESEEGKGSEFIVKLKR